MKFLNLLYGTYGNYNDYGNFGNFDNFGNSSTTNADWASLGGILGGVLAALGVMLIFILAIVVLMLIANWIIFKKMGLDGWKSLIPYVKEYLQMEKTGIDQRWLLIILFGSLICIIPILGFILFLVVIIYYVILYNVSLARSFGKSDGFAVGLILLPFIFLCILAFGDSKYEGPKPMNDIIFKKQVSAVDNEKPKKTAGKKFCPNCGEEISSKDAFCTKCGTKIK